MSKKIYITADELLPIATERCCQETNISWSRDENILSVESSDPTFITKMKSVMQRDPEHYKCYYYDSNIDEQTNRVYAYVFEVDKKLLNFRVAPNKKELTEEQREALRIRFNKK